MSCQNAAQFSTLNHVNLSIIEGDTGHSKSNVELMLHCSKKRWKACSVYTFVIFLAQFLHNSSCQIISSSGGKKLCKNYAETSFSVAGTERRFLHNSCIHSFCIVNHPPINLQNTADANIAFANLILALVMQPSIWSQPQCKYVSSHVLVCCIETFSLPTSCIDLPQPSPRLLLPCLLSYPHHLSSPCCL